MPERSTPEIPLSPCPPSYARLLAYGWDTIQESYDLALAPALVDLMTAAKAEAEAADKKREGLAPLTLGDATYHVRATGARGFRWQLECPDYLLLIASPETDWPVSVRYTAAGLWAHGVEALRARALRSLENFTTPASPDYMRVSRADYCFDFHSPAYFAEMRPAERGVVCHASCKVRETDGEQSTWASSRRIQTIDIGKKSSLQVSAYDKTLEITEASGKTWFYDLWAAAADGEVIDRDVVRLEVRMSSEFLKERNVRRSHELMAQYPALIREALFNRRLTIPQSNDTNRRRWPLHPIWSEAVRVVGQGDMLPIGRKVVGARAAVVKQLKGQFRGLLRAMSVAAFGEYNEDSLRELLADVWKETTGDKEHEKKLEQLLLRYEDLEEAQS